MLQCKNDCAFLSSCALSSPACCASGSSLPPCSTACGRHRRDRIFTPFVPQLLQILVDVADAMAYLHPDIVHRDLKSQNGQII